MSLIRVWKDRKRVSPHRPKRVRTAWLVIGFLLVMLASWVLGRVP